jgi:soluble lytic murein transglycosylase-like protein
VYLKIIDNCSLIRCRYTVDRLSPQSSSFLSSSRRYWRLEEYDLRKAAAPELSWRSICAASLLCAGLAPLAPLHAQVLEIGDDGAVVRIGPGWNEPPSAQLRHGSPLRREIEAAAAAADLDADFLEAVARTESGLNPAAVSSAGAIGVMQLMPRTAAELGVDPRDPAQNLLGGARYLRAQLDRFDGAIDLALAAYNAGAGPVQRYRGVPPFAETQAYVSRNLDRLARAAETQPKDDLP